MMLSRVKRGIAFAQSDQVQFLWNRMNCSISIEDGILHLNCSKHAAGNPLLSLTYQHSIELVNVISTTCGTDKWRVDRNGSPTLNSSLKTYLSSRKTSCFVLRIHYWKKQKKGRRKLQTINLRTSNEKDCKEKNESIKLHLRQVLKEQGYNRPSKLLVIINPNSGKKNAKSVHQKVVGPLFKLAGIEETVFVTKRRFHAQEYIESINMSQYDGVVVFGGDGTISEVINGVVVLEQKNRGIRLDHDPTIIDKQITYAKPSIKFGFIPVGTGNGMSYVSQGVNDPKTSALQIICGENHPMDVSSIHNDRGKLIAFLSILGTFGIGTQAIRNNERFRCLGSLRHILVAINALTDTRRYPCEVFYLQDSTDTSVDLASDLTRCRYPCSICLNNVNESEKENLCRFTTQSLSQDDNEASKHQHSVSSAPIKDGRSGFSEQATNLSAGHGNNWKVKRGYFSSILCCCNSCSHGRCPQGISPSAHMADGTTDLVFLRKTSMKYLRKLYGSGNHLKLPFVETLRVKGFHVRALKDSGVMNNLDQDGSSVASQWYFRSSNNLGNKTSVSGWAVDGEFPKNPEKNKQLNDDITCWVHKGLINVFAKGNESEK